MQPGHIKSYTVAAAVGGRLLVAIGAADGQVALATDATKPFAGVTEGIGSRDNLRVDVVKTGIAAVVLGGTVTRGAALTANASGQAVATTTAGANIIGFAEQAGVAGDVIDVFIAPSRY
jgi:hypothetical protein